MSRPPVPAAAPLSLAAIAVTIHRSVAGSAERAPVARFAHVDLTVGPETLGLGFWDLPPGPGHPIAPLVGFRAPDRWDAVGLISSGRLRTVDDPRAAPTSVLSTVLVDRGGRVASVLGADGGGPLRTIEDPPAGVVPDVLARVLGRATPPPDQTVAAWVDLTWLDRLAGELLPRPARGRSWRWAADRHPLRGTGPVPEPADLAIRTAAYAVERPWSAIGRSLTGTELPAAQRGPSGGSVVDAGGWFDDGSLSRWILRDLPPADALLPDLLAVLPPQVGDSVLTALADVDQAGFGCG